MKIQRVRVQVNPEDLAVRLGLPQGVQLSGVLIVPAHSPRDTARAFLTLDSADPALAHRAAEQLRQRPVGIDYRRGDGITLRPEEPDPAGDGSG